MVGKGVAQAADKRVVLAFDTDPSSIKVSHQLKLSYGADLFPQNALLPGNAENLSRSLAGATHITCLGHGLENSFGDHFNFSPKDFARFLISRCLARRSREESITVDIVGCGVGMIRGGNSYVRQVADHLMQSGYPKVTLRALTSKGLGLTSAGDSIRDFTINFDSSSTRVLLQARCSTPDEALAYDKLNAELERLTAEFQGLNLHAQKISNQAKRQTLDAGQRAEKTRELFALDERKVEIKKLIKDVESEISKRFPLQNLAEYKTLEEALSQASNQTQSKAPHLSQSYPLHIQKLMNTIDFLKNPGINFNKRTRGLIQAILPNLEQTLNEVRPGALLFDKGHFEHVSAERIGAASNQLRGVKSEVFDEIDQLADPKQLALGLIDKRIEQIRSECRRGKPSKVQDKKIGALEAFRVKVNAAETTDQLKALIEPAKAQRDLTRRQILRGKSRTMLMLDRIERRLEQVDQDAATDKKPGVR